MRLGRKRPKIIQDLLHHFFTFFFYNKVMLSSTCNQEYKEPLYLRGRINKLLLFISIVWYYSVFFKMSMILSYRLLSLFESSLGYTASQL